MREVIYDFSIIIESWRVFLAIKNIRFSLSPIFYPKNYLKLYEYQMLIIQSTSEILSIMFLNETETKWEKFHSLTFIQNHAPSN